MQQVLLVLLVAVLVFGVGVVVWNRRNAVRPHPAPHRHEPTLVGPTVEVEVPAPSADTEVSGAPVVEPVDDESPAVEERATFRSRMARARGALAGALLGVGSRDRIDDETWVDLEEALLRANVPYQLIGGTRFYQRREVKDAMAWLRVLRSDTDRISFERILNVPPRGIGEKKIGRAHV